MLGNSGRSAVNNQLYRLVSLPAKSIGDDGYRQWVGVCFSDRPLTADC